MPFGPAVNLCIGVDFRGTSAFYVIRYMRYRRWLIMAENGREQNHSDT